MSCPKIGSARASRSGENGTRWCQSRIVSQAGDRAGDDERDEDAIPARMTAAERRQVRQRRSANDDRRVGARSAATGTDRPGASGSAPARPR